MIRIMTSSCDHRSGSKMDPWLNLLYAAASIWPSFSRQVYDGMRCVRSCHLTGGMSIDPACEMYGHSRKNEVLWNVKRAEAEEYYG